MGRKTTPQVVGENQTAFRVLERKCKSSIEMSTALFVSLTDCPSTEVEIFGLSKSCYTFKGFDGLVLIKNAVPIEMQRQLVVSSLEEYSKPPNVSNLDSHFHLDPRGVWNQFVDSRKDRVEIMIKKRVFVKDDKMLEDGKTIVSVYDPACGIVIDSPVSSIQNHNDVALSKVLLRLRWVTLGLQYDWSKKEYHFERDPPFPDVIAEISKCVVDATSAVTGYTGDGYVAAAGIINFYQPGDSLTAHQDQSEVNAVAPLISISIGLDCAFLVGTTDREDPPIAIHLESGDVVVMCNESRRSFHGVPRVYEGTLPAYLKAGSESLTGSGSTTGSESCPDEERWRLFGEFMSHTRINLNIRQMH